MQASKQTCFCSLVFVVYATDTTPPKDGLANNGFLFFSARGHRERLRGLSAGDEGCEAACDVPFSIALLQAAAARGRRDVSSLPLKKKTTTRTRRPPAPRK